MPQNNKIFLHIAVWAIVTAGVLFWGFPKLANNLTSLQNDHAEQINQLNELKNHAKGIELMQSDLNNLSKQELQPKGLFTSDVQLVNEIKHIEETAANSNVVLEPIGVSGTVGSAQGSKASSDSSGSSDSSSGSDASAKTVKAKPDKNAVASKSGVVSIPFTVTINGDFPAALNFIKYFEHNYFLSPINALTFSVNNDGPMETKITSNFYLINPK